MEPHLKHPPILALVLVSLSIMAIGADLVVTGSNARTFYRDFERLTRQPHYVSPVVALRCTTAPPSAAEIEREKQLSGPHHQARVHLYANAAAVSGFGTPGSSFPVGSIIVKEKLGSDGQVTAVGGMIKRSPGYDFENGDWEYFYDGKPGEFASGRIEACIDCHRGAVNTDHVYGLSFFRNR
jgi:hypothetical protein